MRVIVNESQYNKILIKENIDHKNAKEWASYLYGTLLVNILKLDTTEDVFTHKNLNNKLKTYDFFKNLPIESIIVSIIKNKNLYRDVKIDINYNPYWTTIVEDKLGKKYIKDVEFEVVTYLPNDLTQNNIKKLQSQILNKLTDEFIKIYHWFEKNKEIIPSYSLSPEPLQEIKLYTTEPDLNFGSLGDEIDVLNLIVHDVTSKPIHILNVKEDEVMIDMSSFTTDQINNIEKKIKGYFPDTKVKLNSGEKTLSFIHVDDIEAEKELFKNWYKDDESEEGEEIEYIEDEDTAEIVVSADEEFIVPIPNSNEVYKNNHYFLKDPPNEKVEVKHVYDFLRRKGLSSEQAAGILGNIYHESVFNTGIIGDGGSSMGLCQWHKSRLKKLSSFAKIKDKNITDKDIQLDFLWNELVGRYKSVLNKIKKSTTVKDASFIWASQYEGCADCKNKDSRTNKKRSKKGEEYYEQYKGSNIKNKKKDKKITTAHSKELKILFIGDSQTAGRTSYAHLLNKKYKGTTTIDAVASRNTEQMLTAIKKVNNIGQYNVIVIMGGGNDSWRKTEAYSIKNFTAMYNYVKKANPDALLIAITNPTKKHLPDYNMKWPSNDMIAKWVKNNTLTNSVINANKLGKNYFKVDDFHLNQQGQDWIYDKLQNILKKNKFNI